MKIHGLYIARRQTNYNHKTGLIDCSQNVTHCRLDDADADLRDVDAQKGALHLGPTELCRRCELTMGSPRSTRSKRKNTMNPVSTPMADSCLGGAWVRTKVGRVLTRSHQIGGLHYSFFSEIIDVGRNDICEFPSQRSYCSLYRRFLHEPSCILSFCRVR